MAIVKQFDKRSGITYVLESVSYWDKEKKQSRAKRTVIGRWDPETETIIPTDGRGKRRKSGKTETVPAKRGPVPVSDTRRLFYGATYLFDEIGKSLGITSDLKQCFPHCYKQILSIAYYMILESSNVMLHFPKWAKLHHHPFGEDIPSQRSSELFMSITEEQKMNFFRLQGAHRNKEEFWAYDSTSISSYSDELKLVKWGKNKDYDPLPQMNLVLVFGEDSNLPFYYRKLAGNIPDVKTVTGLVRELNVLGYSKLKLVMDRGFYSAENINELYRKRFKFIVSASTTITCARKAIEQNRRTIQNFENYNAKYDLYLHSETIAWDYTQKRPYIGDTITDEKRMYLHLYYNPAKAVEDERNFNMMMLGLQAELKSGNRNPEHEMQYGKYFEVKSTPVRGVTVTPRQEAMDEARCRHGYFVLLSNEVKNPVTALELYRNRDVVEKAFGNIKERLNCRRMLTSSDSALEGKLFVAFISLIYLSYIKKKMQENKLYEKYTMQEALDELDVIECFTNPGNALFVGEMLKKQKQLFLAFGVEPPENPASLG